MAAGFKTATVASGDVPATQTNFPSYVDLSRLGITTLAEAQSVRVYADSGKTTEWAREIVSATEMHVKIPSLTSTTSIYVDWDGSRADYAVTDTYGRNAVWSDYFAVWHFSSYTDTTDATGNGHTITYGGIDATNETTGQMGGAITFNGTDEYGSVAGTANDFRATQVSITAWFYGQDNASLYLSPDSGPYSQLRVSAGGGALYFRTTNSIVPQVFWVTQPSTGQWNYVAGTIENGGQILYDNGGTADNTETGAFNTTQASFAVVDFARGKYNGVYGYQAGSIGETRYRKSILSSNWLQTEYNNQSDEAGFWGTWSDVGGATAFTPRVMVY